jgi:hypothetical protein
MSRRPPTEPPPTRPPPQQRPLRDEEPFRTLRAEPRRFAVGIPLVFAVAIGAGTLLAERSLGLGVAVLLVVQTGGLLALYLPALRRRLREEADADSSTDPPKGGPTSE